MAVINNSVISFLNTVKKGIFSGGRIRPSLFTMGLGYVGANKLMRGTSNTLQNGGNNIELYRGLYTDSKENIMASGKRGIDSNSGGTSGLVQGLHSNRRKY